LRIFFPSTVLRYGTSCLRLGATKKPPGRGHCRHPSLKIKSRQNPSQKRAMQEKSQPACLFVCQIYRSRPSGPSHSLPHRRKQIQKTLYYIHTLYARSQHPGAIKRSRMVFIPETSGCRIRQFYPRDSSPYPRLRAGRSLRVPFPRYPLSR